MFHADPKKLLNPKLPLLSRSGQNWRLQAFWANARCFPPCCHNRLPTSFFTSRVAVSLLDPKSECSHIIGCSTDFTEIAVETGEKWQKKTFILNFASWQLQTELEAHYKWANALQISGAGIYRSFHLQLKLALLSPGHFNTWVLPKIWET